MEQAEIVRVSRDKSQMELAMEEGIGEIIKESIRAYSPYRAM